MFFTSVFLVFPRDWSRLTPAVRKKDWGFMEKKYSKGGSK
jgi:hypothetical protein